MPTLLNINNYYYMRGGAETIFFEHARLFESSGWNVVPFAMKHPRNLPSEWDRYFVEEIELDSQTSIFKKALSVPKTIYSLEARRMVRELLAIAPPDVCHAHNIYHHISPSILSLVRGSGVPTVLTVHDLKLACPSYTMLARDGICERCKGGRIYNVLLHRCIRQSAMLSTIVMLEAGLHLALRTYERHVDRFVVPSRFHIDKLCEWGMAREQFRHVPNFVDAIQFVPEFAPGSSFVYFGRLSKEKGIGTLIRAAARARCSLRIVGTGPALESMRLLATECGADVDFVGFLTGDRLKDAIRSARAVILPSECYENSPISILEAYALGKPVAAARIGGIPELIREQETGITFRSGDVDELAATLRALMDMPDERLTTMGRLARNLVEAEFDPSSYRERILDVYREIGVKV